MVLMKDRIFYFDELRALAILFVLLAHVIQYFPININYMTSPTLLSYLTISRMGVPLFFMLSGALLLNKEYSLGSFFKKRFSRVLIPAAFWYIILLISVASANGFNFGLAYLWGQGAEFPWFVCAIIGVYLVMPVFNSFIKEYGMKGVEYFILIWVILLILTNSGLVENYYIGLIFANVGIYIGYSVLGYYLANKDFNIYSLPMVVFCVIIFIATIGYNMYNAFYFAVPVYIESISIIIQCSALFLIFRYLSKFAVFNPKNSLSKVHNFVEKSIIGRIVYILSISSYAIYLMHIIVVNFLLQYYPIETFNLIPVVFLLLAIITLAILFVLSKIPGLNKIVGIH